MASTDSVMNGFKAIGASLARQSDSWYLALEIATAFVAIGVIMEIWPEALNFKDKIRKGKKISCRELVAFSGAVIIALAVSFEGVAEYKGAGVETKLRDNNAATQGELTDRANKATAEAAQLYKAAMPRHFGLGYPLGPGDLSLKVFARFMNGAPILMYAIPELEPAKLEKDVATVVNWAGFRLEQLSRREVPDILSVPEGVTVVVWGGDERGSKFAASGPPREAYGVARWFVDMLKDWDVDARVELIGVKKDGTPDWQWMPMFSSRFNPPKGAIIFVIGEKPTGLKNVPFFNGQRFGGFGSGRQSVK